MEPSLLSQSVWLSLPFDTRQKLAKLFEMPEKGSVIVNNGPTGSVVQSDGYGYDHFKLVTLEKMNNLLGTDTDNFYAAFRDIVANLDELVNPPAFIEETVIVDIEGDRIAKEIFDNGFTTSTGDTELTKPKKRGRPKKAK